MTTSIAKIQIRRDLSTNLNSIKPDYGEFAYSYDTKQLKIGDISGTTWAELDPFLTNNSTTGINIAGSPNDALHIGGTPTTGINVVGNATAQAINVSGTTPIGLNISGVTSQQGINISGSTPTGLSVSHATAKGVSIGASPTDAVYIGGTPTTGINVVGNATAQAINVSGTTPIGLNVSGITSQQAINVSGSTPTGLYVSNPTAQGVSIGGLPIDAVYIGGTPTTGINVVGNATAQAINVSGTTPIGLNISGANSRGIVVTGATSQQGINVSCITPTGLYVSNATAQGVSIGGSPDNGIYIGGTPTTGINIGDGTNTIPTGLIINKATTGIDIVGSGATGVKIEGSTSSQGILVSGATPVGLNITAATTSGISVGGTPTTGINIGDGTNIIPTGLTINKATTGINVSLDSTNKICVDGIQVIGQRQPGVSPVTDLPGLISQFNILISRLQLHGLINNPAIIESHGSYASVTSASSPSSASLLPGAQGINYTNLRDYIVTDQYTNSVFFSVTASTAITNDDVIRIALFDNTSGNNYYAFDLAKGNNYTFNSNALPSDTIHSHSGTWAVGDTFTLSIDKGRVTVSQTRSSTNIWNPSAFTWTPDHFFGFIMNANNSNPLVPLASSYNFTNIIFYGA